MKTNYTKHLGFLKSDSNNVKKWSSSKSELNTVELSRDVFRSSTTLKEKLQYVFNHAVVVLLAHHLLINYTPLSERFNLLSMAGIPLIMQRIIGIFATIYLMRKLTQTALITITYTSSFTSIIENQTPMRVREAKRLNKIDRIVKRITLEKSGVKYDAYIIGYKDTIKSGKWTIHSLAPGTTAEEALSTANVLSTSLLSNCLLINGPMVNSSTGIPTHWSMSAGYEAGLQFMERKLKAKQIVIYGYSLAELQMGEAITKHDFRYGKKHHIEYLVISDRSCESSAKRTGVITFGFVEQIMKLVGANLESVSAAKKIMDLDIKHIVIQNKKGKKSDPDSDDVIPNKVGLLKALKMAKLTKNKIFFEGRNISNDDPLVTLPFYPQVKEEVWKFFTSNPQRPSSKDKTS